MVEFSASERERRRRAEAGFWKEMEERGLSRIEAWLDDGFYERLNEIRRGLIVQADFDRRDRRVDALLSSVANEHVEDMERSEAEYYEQLGRSV